MAPLITFNAGRVSFNEVTQQCTPEPLKGSITIKPSEEGDLFFDFTWAPREATPGVTSDELLVIAGDVEWTHVPSCTTGRVYSLTFLSSGAKNLYWMQELNDDENDDPAALSKKDVEIASRITKLFSEPEEEDVETPDAVPTKDDPADINDAISSQVVEAYINKLSDAELEPFYAHLPQSHERTRQGLLSVLKSGFFLAAGENLSKALGDGAGMVVSQTLGTVYKGEGVENFLEAVRQQARQQARKLDKE